MRKKKVRHAMFMLAMLGLCLALTVTAGEIFLRVVYRDAGSKTQGAPGGEEFLYEFSEKGYRGPRVKGPKKPGVRRILILGDSITYGWGLSDWKDLYPYRLREMLNTGGERFEIASFAHSGREIDKHLEILDQTMTELQPDIVVYQWYVNDLEINGKHRRPVNKNLFWRAYPSHKELKRLSFLYHFLDNRLAVLVPRSGQTYAEYLLDHYGGQGKEWIRFRHTFHDWATLATSEAEKVILMLYPYPPATENGPLRSLYTRMRKISGASVLRFPGYTSLRQIGENVKDRDSFFGVVRAAREQSPGAGTLASWPNIRLNRGRHEMTFWLKAGAPSEGRVAVIDINHEGVSLARMDIPGPSLDPPGTWKKFTLSFDVKEKLAQNIAFNVRRLGGADISFDRAELPVDYGIEALDLTPKLAAFNTYVSLFDAHPNARAHNAMAEALYQSIAADESQAKSETEPL